MFDFNFRLFFIQIFLVVKFNSIFISLMSWIIKLDIQFIFLLIRNQKFNINSFSNINNILHIERCIDAIWFSLIYWILYEQLIREVHEKNSHHVNRTVSHIIAASYFFHNFDIWNDRYINWNANKTFFS